MVTKLQVNDALSRALDRFERCWGLLASMKNGNLETESELSLVEFQPLLAETIFDLSAIYREIASEKRQRIAKKVAYSPTWFRRRMVFLGKQQEAINRAHEMGRTLGDGFAWFFYREERKFLREHLALQRPMHAPPGIGGAGELNFIKNVQKFEDHFVLYHGITNMLRLGDVSLIDLKGSKVAGIGELKSRLKKPGVLDISLIVTGPMITEDFVAKRQEGIKKRPSRTPLPPKARDRLQRQLKRVDSSFVGRQKKPNKRIATHSDNHFNVLDDLLSNLKQGRFAFRQAGKSLILTAYRMPNASPINKFTGRNASKLSGLESISEFAKRILVPEREDNSLIIGSLLYTADGKSHHLPGMYHPLWWPLSVEAARDLLLQNVIVTTVFNPVHLKVGLEALGLEVTGERLEDWKITKQQGKFVIDVEGINFYARMIQQYMFVESAVVEVIEQSLSDGAVDANTQSMKIDIHVEQHFGSRPTRI